LLGSNIFSTCPHNMVDFGPLVAEIVSLVWGTPANFNGFRVLAVGSVTARHSSSRRQPNLAALNRGRHLYSAGRPSRWALAHISSLFRFYSAPQCSHCKRCTSYNNSVRPAVRLSVRPSVYHTPAGIVSKRLHVARCSLHCQIAKCV